ncbi:Cna B-type protein [Candidatus Koribacter versatilis Ellin345]|uniref:Cna B-type protein n=1 Tax=Koribacter versatilis (strain Ellin345) TaxID=204669 RepID=Q1IU20_KORVE|nr:carboxypeptidase-like regulatory domain-containing protein [Candidatus Koribacter versatilis]ABF39630.1 Cna B-type protein [Candidatus Koribacter versatilis Ellin345]
MRYWNVTVRFVALALLLTSLPLLAGAQATTSLHGTVTDTTGAIVSGAKVTLSSTATNMVRQTTSNDKGIYDLESLMPGAYKLTVTAQGFRTMERPELTLKVNLPATENIVLAVGAANETVEVTGEAPLLNTTDSSVGHNMGGDEIEQIPLRSENMPLLLSFQPGVAYNGDKLLADSYDTRAGAVNGEHSDQNNITLDGVSNNDEFSGYSFIGVLPSTAFSTQEFRVTTSNYTAEQGRSAGAQISMVTKSGTNRFHGDLYEYNRNTIGEANDFFLKNAQIANGQPNTPEKLVHNTFGGDVGGPIIKDRLFFFFNYEGHRQSYSASEFANIPSTTLRDGIIQYACDTPSQCPAKSVTGISGNAYPIQAGWNALTASELGLMDPLGVGPNSAALSYFNGSFPQPNQSALNDAPNYGGYRWAAPTRLSENWYIGRLDWNITKNGNHTLFLRGAARNDSNDGAPFLPGDSPQYRTIDLSKGLVAGYTAAFTPHMVNNVRYGITHQSIGTLGNSSQAWVFMRDMDQGITYSSQFIAPVHNIADTLTWTKGTHSFSFGGNILFIRRSDTNYNSSFSDALTNADWLAYGGFANKNDPLDPAYGCSHGGPCHPAVASNFTHSYDFPLAAMMGIASEIDAQYNYSVKNTSTADPMAQGAPVARNWSTDTYILYAQDSWQARRNLTISYGLNYQLMTPITETKGQEVTPDVNMGAWFNRRAGGMLQGTPDNSYTPISFAPSGNYWGRSGLYSAQTKNFAPRIGISWSPEPNYSWLKKLTGDHQTVLRAGFGMYYDNFGPALALHYDAGGTFGLSTNLSNPASQLTLACPPGSSADCIAAPRITSMNEIPVTNGDGVQIMPGAPPSNFPVEYSGVEAIARGIDQSVKTPYSYAVNFSIQRELPWKMVLDLGYVGHFGHRILGLDDIAAPLNLIDPKSGISYYQAATRLSQMWRAGVPEGSITPSAIGPTAAYWQNMMKNTGSYAYCSQDGSTANMLQAIYDAFGPGCGSLYNETSGLYNIDLGYLPGLEPIGGFNSYYNSQYSSLWDWRSIGHSNYHGLQVSLRKDVSNGVSFGFNYTYSKSMDIESQSERGAHYLTSSIINPFDVNQMYGPSDFDLRHQINAYWVADLPFGRGKKFGNDMNRWMDTFLGGWQLNGTTRWSSGYPVSMFMGYVWPTNWDEMGWANTTGNKIATGTTIINGTPWIFKNPTQASLDAASGGPFDYAYPGQSGSRNNIRGDGYFAVDMSISKNWKIKESNSFQLRWSVFNVTNSTRFDAYNYMQTEWDSGSLGQYSGTLTQPRIMEFSGIFRF